MMKEVLFIHLINTTGTSVDTSDMCGIVTLKGLKFFFGGPVFSCIEICNADSKEYCLFSKNVKHPCKLKRIFGYV
jgi:hypothetical protein